MDWKQLTTRHWIHKNPGVIYVQVERSKWNVVWMVDFQILSISEDKRSTTPIHSWKLVSGESTSWRVSYHESRREHEDDYSIHTDLRVCIIKSAWLSIGLAKKHPRVLAGRKFFRWICRELSENIQPHYNEMQMGVWELRQPVCY